jgi:hypothetical protein
MINIPAAINSWPTWVDGPGVHEPAVMPAAEIESQQLDADDFAAAIDSERDAFAPPAGPGGVHV